MPSAQTQREKTDHYEREIASVSQRETSVFNLVIG